MSAGQSFLGGTMSVRTFFTAAVTAVVLSATSAFAATSNFDGNYDVLNANGGEHGVWLNRFLIDSNGNTLSGNYNYWGIADGSFVYDGMNATLTADVVNYGDSDLTLTLNMDLTRTLTAPASPKCEQGGCDTSDWEYFTIDPTATLTGYGDLAGLVLEMTEHPSVGVHPPQIGIGANSKTNSELGFAVWFDWTVTSGANGVAGSDYGFDGTSLGNSQHGDINIALAPVPLPAGAVLLFTGLAGLGVMRRRRKTS